MPQTVLTLRMSPGDGKSLDSADHKSHMAYSGTNGNGDCPSTHPVKMISLLYEAWFSIGDFSDRWDGPEWPFVYSMGDTTGFGFHGDFAMGWNNGHGILQQLADVCTSSEGDGDPKFFSAVSINVDNAQCTIPSSVNEDIMGPLKQLPGCNNGQPDCVDTVTFIQ